MADSAVTVVTESGYLMLVKSFTDELAWQIQRMLVNTYFRTQVITPDEEFDRQVKLAEINIKSMRAKAMLINACTRHMKTYGARLKGSGLSPESIQTAAIKSLEEITGDSLGSILPQVDTQLRSLVQSLASVPTKSASLLTITDSKRRSTECS